MPLRYKYSTVRIFSLLNNLRSVRKFHRTDSGASRATFLPRTVAWRIARDGITMRPLAEERLRLVTNLAMRSDSWFSGVVSG